MTSLFVSHPCKCGSAQLSIFSFARAWKSSHLFARDRSSEVKEKSYISTVFQLIIFIQIMEEFTERFYCKWYIFDIFGILCHDWPRTRIIFIFYFWTISGFYLGIKFFPNTLLDTRKLLLNDNTKVKPLPCWRLFCYFYHFLLSLENLLQWFDYLSYQT